MVVETCFTYTEYASICFKVGDLAGDSGLEVDGQRRNIAGSLRLKQMQKEFKSHSTNFMKVKPSVDMFSKMYVSAYSCH